MAVDQAGDDIAAGQIDLLRARDIGGGQAAMRRQRDDPFGAPDDGRRFLFGSGHGI